jgi:alkanesulfonate monooxygenase SsuD/methylene tetrahydromethanopterin reductase-like flavin-dependent oxidoreductase (luciferase family)
MVGQGMQFFPNLPGAAFADPGGWARDKEAQGWHGICASDHILVGSNAYPHVFVTATALAVATERLIITTSFANNLFRSPVEFAQAALSLQNVSNGRFEAGLGAGWAEHEMQAMGLTYPDGPTRVSMYVEALTIVAKLLATGQCEFHGEHYNIEIGDEFALGPMPELSPPLIASAGGPRAIREVTPIADRLELKANARSTRGGALDLQVMSTVTEDEFKAQIQRAKEADPAKPLGVFILTAAGAGAAISGLKSMMGDGFLGQFMGHPETVAQALLRLASLGIDRVQLTELAPGSHDALADYLLHSSPGAG